MNTSAVAKWTAIVLTCRNEQIANAFLKGCYKRVYSVYIISGQIFTARCYAERGYAAVCRLSVRLSVYP